jgi:hypothetical protein
MGVKPAALFAVQGRTVFASLAAVLPGRLTFGVLRESEKGLLVFVFDPEALEKTIMAAAAVLSDLGYPKGASASAALGYLKKQFGREPFPHEVGFFLGYPIDDVLGFVEHKGQNYKLCGYWKVYGDVEQAKLCFRQYDMCRGHLQTVMNAGSTLAAFYRLTRRINTASIQGLVSPGYMFRAERNSKRASLGFPPK